MYEISLAELTKEIQCLSIEMQYIAHLVEAAIKELNRLNGKVK